MKRLLFLPILATFLLSANAQSNILFVKEGGNGNGHSWTSPLGDLQEALHLARPGTEIWVAAGRYTPTRSHDRRASFFIPDGVALYGGFIGQERSRDQRDWERNQTVLSGEIGTPSSDDNSFSVVITRNVTRKTIVDGFTISGGAANGAGEIGNPERSGAGMFNDGSKGASHPTIANCLFKGNIAREGAGLFNYAANGSCKPDIINSRFVKNVADLDGGAIYNDGSSGICSPRITNCAFNQNESMYGAGIMNRAPHGEARPMINECSFTQNVSSVKGSSIFSNLSEKGTCEAILRGCRFSDNVSSLGSGNDVVGGTISQQGAQMVKTNSSSRSKASIQSYR